MNLKIQQALFDIWLNNTEISVYLELLTIWTTLASPISKRTKINRCTVLYSLENLVKKELAMKIKKNWAFYFTPEDPEKILLLLNTEKENLKRKENSAKQIIWDLKLMKNPNINMPKVQFFEGVNWIKKAYELFLDNIPEKSVVFSYSNLLSSKIDTENFNKSIQTFIEKRIFKKIFLKYLMPNSKKSIDYLKKIPPDQWMIKIVNSEKIPFNTEEFGGQILIFKNTMLSVFMKKNSAFAYKVEHFEITAIHQHVFETLWNQLPDPLLKNK